MQVETPLEQTCYIESMNLGIGFSIRLPGRTPAHVRDNAAMSDNKTTPSDLDLLIARMGDLAREIGEMDPNDPLCAMRVKELYTLTQLSKSLQT
jgi:hypothetical protein